MAYSTNLAEFSLARFAEVLTTVELIPSRRILADHISSVVPRLADMGVADLDALRRLLADKKRYQQLAAQLKVDAEYLTVLNREINSYRAKPMPLAKLDWFTPEELGQLGQRGIRTTKHLYERCAAKADRSEIASSSGVSSERIVGGLELSNLVRINGVGPAFAHFLRGLGVVGPADIVATETAEIISRYEESIADRPGQPKLRPEDIEFCKRFAAPLESDIEW